jgi:hypothetical protein
VNAKAITHTKREAVVSPTGLPKFDGTFLGEASMVVKMPGKTTVAPVQVKAEAPTVFFELSEVQVRGKSSGWHRISTGKNNRIEEAGQDLSQLVDSIKPIAATIVAGFQSMGAAAIPSEIGLELGVKLSGEIGFFVAKSVGEASLGLKLTWKR